jgi:putative transcriptional regulator
MKEELFRQLVTSVREGGGILRGETKPSRSFAMDGPSVKQLRAQYQLSQRNLAALLGISVATLRNWEQGRRVPEGPARILLQVAARHPEAIWDTIHPDALRDQANAEE